MSFEEEEPYLFGESEEGGTETLEETGTKSTATEKFPLEAYEITVELADLWDSAVEGKVSVEELKETLAALQSLILTPKRRRRRRG